MDIFTFGLALTPPILWAICNLFDKWLLSRLFKGDHGVGTLMIVSALSAGLAAPLLYLVDPTVLEVTRENIGVIGISAALDVLLIWAYLKALQKDHSYNVIIYYQLVPVMGIASGYLFLGEIITTKEMAAMAIIIFGTSIVSLEQSKGRFYFKRRTVIYMLIACACWAAQLAIFKVAAVEENPWRSLFWKHVVLAGYGILMFCLVPTYRKSFLNTMKSNSAQVLLLNLVNEGLYILGTVLYGIAVVRAPVSLVLLTETFQSFFVLGSVLLIARYMPSMAIEKIERERLYTTLIALAITLLGSQMLLST